MLFCSKQTWWARRHRVTQMWSRTKSRQQLKAKLNNLFCKPSPYTQSHIQQSWCLDMAPLEPVYYGGGGVYAESGEEMEAGAPGRSALMPAGWRKTAQPRPQAISLAWGWTWNTQCRTDTFSPSQQTMWHSEAQWKTGWERSQCQIQADTRGYICVIRICYSCITEVSISKSLLEYERWKSTWGAGKSGQTQGTNPNEPHRLSYHTHPSLQRKENLDVCPVWKKGPARRPSDQVPNLTASRSHKLSLGSWLTPRQTLHLHSFWCSQSK